MLNRENAAGLNVEFIIDHYGRLVTSICRRMIQDEDKAKDAAQEVWLQVVKSLPKYQGTAKISTWLYTVARRVVMDYAQKERIYTTRFLKDYFRGEILVSPDTPDFDRTIWVREMCDKCLTGTLHCLDNEARLAYLFRDIAQLPYREIAQVLERRETAVRQSVTRTRRKLRAFLSDECAIYNPAGTCNCRMKQWVTKVGLPLEYEKIRRVVQRVNLYKESEKVLPPKNYWEKYL